MLLAFLAVFWPVVVRQQTLFPVLPGVLPGAQNKPAFLLDPMDTTWQNYPLARFVRNSWKAGRPPVWNPFAGCGEPVVASGVGAVTSPLRLWTALAEAGPGCWDFFLLARLLLAGAFGFAFARALGLGAAGSFTAGTGYMLSGFLVLNLNQAFLDAEVLLPALGLGIVSKQQTANSKQPEGEWRKGGRLAWVFTALVGGAILLSGQPQSAFVAGLFASALAVSCAVRSGAGIAVLGRNASAGFVAILLGAPFLFAFLDFLPRAQHVHAGQGLSPEPIRGAVSLVAPWLLGNFGERWLGLNPFRFLPYIGMSVAALAALGARRAWRRSPFGPALVAAPAFLLMGAYGIPPVSWLAHLPFLDSLWWGKYQGPAVLSLAVLAGFGVEALAGGVRRPRLRRAVPWLAAGAVAAELFLLAPRQRPRPFDPLPPDPYLDELAGRADFRNARVWGSGRAFMPHTGSALGIPDVRTYFAVYPVRAYWYLRGLVTGPATNANEAVFTGSPRTLPPLAAPGLRALAARWIVTAGEPGDLAGSLEPAGDAMWWKADGRGRAGRMLAEGEAARLTLVVPSGGAVLEGSWAGLGGPAACAAAVGGRTARIQGDADKWTGFRILLDPDAGARQSVVFSAGSGIGFLGGLVLRSGGGTVLGAEGKRAVPAGRLRKFFDGSVQLHELAGALPRARLASRALRVETPANAIFEASGEPANGKTVYVEAPPGWAGFGVRGRAAPALVTADEGWRMDVAVPGRGTRLLVVADTWEPGWRAYAGGVRLAVHPADCMFRAVAVPGGAETVSFAYSPLPLRLGLLSGGLGLGLLLLGFLPGRGPVRGRRSPG